MATLLITLFASLVTFLFLSGVIFESPKDRSIILRGVRISMKKLSAGILVYFMGAVGLVTWAHYILAEIKFFAAEGPFSLTHASTHLATSILLVVAGHAVLRNWRKNGVLFFFTIGITLLQSMISLLQYNTGTQPPGLYMVVGAVAVIGSFIASAFYAADLIFSSSNVKQTPSEKHRTYVD